MTSPAKAKGTRWETAIERFLEAVGLRPVKPRQAGFEDLGDVQAWPFVIQAKDWKSWEAAIREGLDGAVRQAENVNSRRPGSGWIGVAVVKRARRPVGDAYAVMRLSDLTRLTRRGDV